MFIRIGSCLQESVLVLKEELAKLAAEKVAVESAQEQAQATMEIYRQERDTLIQQNRKAGFNIWLDNICRRHFAGMERCDGSHDGTGYQQLALLEVPCGRSLLKSH